MSNENIKRTCQNYKTDAAGVKQRSGTIQIRGITMHKRSIFKNIKLYKTIVVLTAILSSSLLIVKAETSNDKTLVITANRTEQNINDILAAVDIITREDIERIQPESITDLLANISGFDFAFSGGAGQTSSLFTRGSSSDHTLIIIDGVRVGSATLGNKSFSDIPVAQIERIEIVRGSRASLWGSDAIAGVIQIFTRRLNVGQYSIEATVGSDDFVATNLSVGFGSEKISNTVTVSLEESAGFDAFNDASEFGSDSEPDNDGYQRISAAIRGDYELSNETNLDWVFQYDDGENSFDNFFGDNENEYQNNFWNIRYTHTVGKWQSEFSVKQSNDKASSFDSRVEQSDGSIFKTQRNQVNAVTHYDWMDEVNLSAGVDYYKDDVGGTTVNLEVEERTSKAAFISSIVNVNRFIGEFSARYDDVDSAGSENTFNISLGYKILDNVTLSASRAKGFKAPTFNDLYFPNFSNSDLVSEVSYNTEFLIKAHWKKHSLMLVGYENKVDQLIAFSFNPVTFEFLPFNIDKASLKGHEVVYKYQQGSLSHKITASFVDAIDKSIDSFTSEAKNEQLLRRAKEHYGYELIAALGDFSFFVQANYIGKRRDNDFSTFPATPVSLKSHIKVNIGATFQAAEQLSFKFKVSDFTDSNESTVFNYNAPGQQVYFTVQYRNF